MYWSVEIILISFQNELSGNGKFHILFLFFVSTMFSISVVSLWGYHIYLVLHNRSTLGNDTLHITIMERVSTVLFFSEAYRAPIFRSGPDKDGFNLGKYNNFVEVFGDRKALWFIPIFTRLFYFLNSYSLSIFSISSLSSAQLYGDHVIKFAFINKVLYQFCAAYFIRIPQLLSTFDQLAILNCFKRW